MAIAIALTEPPNGIIANLLSIEGKPEIALGINGAGPVADLTTTMTLDAGGTRALSGTATIRQQAEGLAIGADLRGPIATLITEAYRPFFGAETSLMANALVRTAGGLDISGIRLSGGQLSLEGSATTTADGFLRTLQLRANVADPAGERVLLPIPGATTDRVGAACGRLRHGCGRRVDSDGLDGRVRHRGADGRHVHAQREWRRGQPR